MLKRIRSSLVRWVAVVGAIAFAAADVSASSVEYVPTIRDVCDESKGATVLIEFGRGWDALGNYDCVMLRDQGSIAVYRYIAGMRRMLLVQRFQPAGVPPPAGVRRPNDSPRFDALSVAIGAEGVAVEPDGQVVYVAAAVPTDLLLSSATRTPAC